MFWRQGLRTKFRTRILNVAVSVLLRCSQTKNWSTNLVDNRFRGCETRYPISFFCLAKRTNDLPVLGQLRLVCPFFDPNWRDSSYDVMESLFACYPMPS
ncbi:hypothetical protein EDB82DRAFT_22390 [Fusarium venenatum]|uniref:uncharacterized protein n=1 Tax=Fusarium venenatum TaxID=56646 RepID=UPI001D294EFD|nr:hypothetical protein EDB82DRAFT_22390 [Fusarium venenatum]